MWNFPAPKPATWEFRRSTRTRVSSAVALLVSALLLLNLVSGSQYDFWGEQYEVASAEQVDETF
jgi:hypothetical protein